MPPCCLVGNEMDKYDRQRLNQVYETQPSGQSAAWVNPDTGNQYTVTPEPAFTNPSTDQVCRDAVINAVIDGREQQVHTTACRGPDGQWHVEDQ